MDVTTELRWIWREGAGGVARPMIDQFAAALGVDASTGSERTDDYLLFPSPALGVKVREGRLEIKQLLGARVDPEARGRIEQWVKWSGPAHPDVSAERAGGWIRVRKQRRAVAFALAEGQLRRQSDAADIDQGCQVELTALEVTRGEGRWQGWTVAFEAFPDPAQQESWLRGVQRQLAAALAPLPCTVVASCSYPEWLSRIAL